MSAGCAIDAPALARWLDEPGERAMLDLRSPDRYGKGAPLQATPVSARLLPAWAPRWIPRRATPIVLVDDGDGVADGAAAGLASLGYADVRVLAGGVAAWTSTASVQGKAFCPAGVDVALSIAARADTPALDIEGLRAWQAAGTPFLLLDTRTRAEFVAGHVPGARHLPGADLLQGIAALNPPPDLPIVVTCAGLPRAILGAQTLRGAGLPNPVAYLAHGTAGWLAAGHALAQGEGTHRSPATGPGGAPEGDLALACQRASRLGAGVVAHVGRGTVESWLRDASRTTLVLDLRPLEEARLAPVPGALAAEGGQLFASPFRVIPVRDARIVLLDAFPGLRAYVTGHWLRHHRLEVALWSPPDEALRPAASDARA